VRRTYHCVDVCVVAYCRVSVCRVSRLLRRLASAAFLALPPCCLACQPVGLVQSFRGARRGGHSSAGAGKNGCGGEGTDHFVSRSAFPLFARRGVCIGVRSASLLLRCPLAFGLPKATQRRRTNEGG